MEALIKIQSELNAPKNQFNKFGNYKYRSCEDILEAIKPLLVKYGATMYISDTIENVGNRYYIKATVTLTVWDTSVSATAYAREEESKKGMDGSQITGSSSSYARKYALNGLFLIDDSKDADTEDNGAKETKNDYVKKIKEYVAKNVDFKGLDKDEATKKAHEYIKTKTGRDITMEEIYDNAKDIYILLLNDGGDK